MWFSFELWRKIQRETETEGIACSGKGVELISLQLQGHPRSKEKAFQTSCCHWLPDFGSLERAGIPNIKCLNVSLCHHQILPVPAGTRESFLPRLNHAFPTLLKVKQSIRALLSGSDISQVWINIPPGPGSCGNQWKISSSFVPGCPWLLPVRRSPSTSQTSAQHLPEWFSKVFGLPWKAWRGNGGMLWGVQG